MELQNTYLTPSINFCLSFILAIGSFLFFLVGNDKFFALANFSSLGFGGYLTDTALRSENLFVIADVLFLWFIYLFL